MRTLAIVLVALSGAVIALAWANLLPLWLAGLILAPVAVVLWPRRG